MTELVKLAPGALAVGQALPWTVYGKGGALLVRKGYVIHSDRQLERLYEDGFFYSTKTVLDKPLVDDELVAPRLNPFAEYATLLQDMETALSSVLAQEEHAQHRVLRLVDRLDRLCTSEPDACLAFLHNNAREPTAFEEGLYHAILCRLVAERLELESECIKTLLTAALTANVALVRHLDKLNSSRKELSDAQRTIIRKHPILSATAVQQAGMSDPDLLKIIEQHHEHFDGSGYPAGLNHSDIVLEARILALAERYTAMISPRAYRTRFRADQAMGEILASSAMDPNPTVAHALVRELTPYPPGVMVRLGSGEIAVITHRPIAREAPMAQAVISPKGNPYIGAFFRDCDEHRIESIVVPERPLALNMSALWGYL